MFVEINGALLYQRRKAMQLTLDKLARASGLSYQALTMYEAHAHTACEPMILAKLITALRCTDEDLLYRSGDGAIAARVETFFEKIERNGIALTEVLKRALHPNSGETMRFRSRVLCDLLARNARVETFFEKIERNGIALTEVLKRALHPNSGETMRFRSRVLCDLLARNYNNMVLQCDAKAIYTIIFDSHLCTSELELLHHPNTEARLTILPTHISEISGLSPTRKEQILSLLQTDTSKIDTLIRIYGYLLDGLYNMQNQRAVHNTFVTICDLLDTPKPPSQYQVDEFCYAITLILLNYSILQRRFSSQGIKTTTQKQLF